MAEFNIARVRSHMCRGLVIFGLLVSHKHNAHRKPTNGEYSQCASNTELHSESQFQRNCSNPKLLSCLPVVGKKCNDQEVKKEILKAKIPNGIDGLGVENGKTIRNKTVTRIGVDHDDISINLSPHFFMKFL